MKTLIYRVENKDKIGFFSDPSIDWRKTARLGRSPAPYDDKGIKRDMKITEKCGFLNEKQLYDWLKHNDLKMLEKHGQKLKRKYVEVTAIGEHQVLYREGA